MQRVRNDQPRAIDAAFNHMWDAVTAAVPEPLADKSVLHIGCGDGAFLAFLADHHGIASGDGFDISLDLVEAAEGKVKNRPLRFAVSDRIPVGWSGYDVAFGHEVLYLLDDLTAHADQVFRGLTPGASYYATMGAHRDNPLTELWHAALATGREMPPIYSLDDVALAFETAGFEVSACRIEPGFIPYRAHVFPSLFGALEYYTHHKVLFRFRRPRT